MDPFGPFFRLKFLLLLLEQGDRSLEDHTRLFLALANHTSYPDDALCSFYDKSLNTTCRPLSVFTAFVESPFTVETEDDLASPTLDPAPSPPSPHYVEPEPTANGEPEPTETIEPSPHGVTELRIAAEPALHMTSVQVCRTATTVATREKAVVKASDIAEGSSAHCNMAECDLVKDLGLFEAEGVLDWDIYADLPP
ncbi:hypothetical protein M9458_029751, partial [Cirrhinus mrigala]